MQTGNTSRAMRAADLVMALHSRTNSIAMTSVAPYSDHV